MNQPTLTDMEEALIGLYTRLSNLEQNGIPGVRDFFATSALSVLARDHFKLNAVEEIAQYCYDVADAMMIERAKNATK